jgi:biopolymer transport protein ExbD
MGTVTYMKPRHGRVAPSYEPMAAMNMTPLIDVLLVLLVMLILTVPMALHKVDVDLPVAVSPSDRNPVVQKLALAADGTVFWNGAVVNDAQLNSVLKDAAANKDDLQFQTQGNARYERFDQLIAQVKRSGVTQIGFSGNSAYKDFSK